MTRQINNPELFVEISEAQQEAIAGGADFELSNTNFAQRLAFLGGQTASGPWGSSSNSVGGVLQINTAAQDFLALGTNNIPSVGGLGNAPAIGGNDGGTGVGGGNLGGGNLGGGNAGVGTAI